MKDMYRDIEAARTLGMSNSKIRKEIKKRKGIKKDIVSQVLKGIYTPKKPTQFFKDKMRKINRDLNKQEGVDIENPYSLARPFIRQILRMNRRIDLLNDYLKFPDINIENKAQGGRVGMQEGGDIENVNDDKDLATSIWISEPEPVKQSFDYDFNKYYASGVWIEKIGDSKQASVPEAPKQPLPPTPPVNPEAMKDPMVNTNLMQTGLTQTEQALLSNEEKSIRLRQRGLSR